ncbi:MAG TPA: methylmalonyl-CoA mutase family protein, partial [Terriglobia bacterium]|nr:methylmalonyl-CoA mutase family protein [Terriglobia bacterium]
MGTHHRRKPGSSPTIEPSEEAVARWKDQSLKPVLEKSPERDSPFTTLSGVPVQGLYTPADLADFEYARDLGDPGEYPFTRGIHPTMYRGKLSTMPSDPNYQRLLSVNWETFAQGDYETACHTLMAALE